MSAARDNVKATALDVAPGLGMDWEGHEQRALQSVVPDWQLLWEMPR